MRLGKQRKKWVVCFLMLALATKSAFKLPKLRTSPNYNIYGIYCHMYNNVLPYSEAYTKLH